MHTFLLICFWGAIQCCCLHAMAQSDTTSNAKYFDFAQFGEHSFKVTHNEYVGKIAPTPLRPYETTVYIALGQNDKQGYLALTAANVWENELIDGDVTITLMNEQNIVCRRKKLYSTSQKDGMQVAIGLYFLTFSQLKTIAAEGVKSLYFPLIDVRTEALLPCVFQSTAIKFNK